MIAIRGATTVENDTPEEIRESVRELMGKLTALNGLDEKNTVLAIFSSTKDLRSFYPATAARETGFCICPLFSAEEPDIKGSLKKCIRVAVLAEICGKPKHVYLKKAENLRKDLKND